MKARSQKPEARSRIGMIVVILMVLSTSASAQTVRTWISTTGNDANPCTRALPCRNLAAGIVAVSPGGEVVVADSGGYGSVTVNKAVSIISPPGLHAAIAPTTGTAVSVDSGVDDVVVLRGLYLNSQGANAGIEFLAGKSLHMENMVVNGFADDGVRAQDGNLFIKDSLIRNTGTGITVLGGFASIDHTQIERNNVGVSSLFGAKVTVRDSAAAGNVSAFRAQGLNSVFEARLNLESCMISNNQFGVSASQFSIMMVSNCVVSGNEVGVTTHSASAVVRVTGSSISGNLTGVAESTGSVLASFGNNALAGNDLDGDFSETIGLQ